MVEGSIILSRVGQLTCITEDSYKSKPDIASGYSLLFKETKVDNTSDSSISYDYNRIYCEFYDNGIPDLWNYNDDIEIPTCVIGIMKPLTTQFVLTTEMAELLISDFIMGIEVIMTKYKLI